jgi:hypothetical protein
VEDFPFQYNFPIEAIAEGYHLAPTGFNLHPEIRWLRQNPGSA